MTLQQLGYFKQVAEMLHFTRAAQALFITPSALSYSISSLERELGVPLFIRENGRSVSLTRYGEALLPLAADTLCGVGNIEQTIRGLRDPLSGIVNVTYSYINCHHFVPKMFSSFAREAASRDITINFEINHKTTHFEDDVARGKSDLAFSCTPRADGLTVVPFARQKLYVMVPVGHPLAERARVTIPDICGEPLVCYDRGRNLDRRILELFDSNGCRPDIECYTSDWVVQLSFVALGQGIAILPELPFDDELVKRVELDDPLSVRDIYMMWPSGIRPLPVVEYVRDYCLGFYSEPPLF